MHVMLHHHSKRWASSAYMLTLFCTQNSILLLSNSVSYQLVQVKEAYLKQKPMASREETYAAIRELTALLNDPFTRFLEPARFSALKRGNTGDVTGVGLEVGFDSSAGAAGSLLVRPFLN